MSPYELKLLLNIYAIPEKPEGLTDVTLRNFVELGLVRQKEGAGEGWEYYPTERLCAFCYMLMETPLPKHAFFDPRSLKIIEEPK